MRQIEDRVIDSSSANCSDGSVHWAPVKSVLWTVMTLGWVIGGAAYFSWSAVLVFFGMCAITLWGGHSLGMHRKLIHDSFDCPKWLERLGVYLGTLVGLGGPFTMMKTHDMRDWAQRQTDCHPYFRHGSSMIQDFWWQIHCDLRLENPPDFHFPDNLTKDKFMILLEKSVWVQHVIVGLMLFCIGGWGWVFWGLCGRVSISIFGHWFVGYWAHNHGHQDWIVKDAAVQGHNVRYCGLITFGECWHNNHHAFPESAKLGLYDGQADPGWWILKTFERIGIVGNLVLPGDIPSRKNLVKLRK